MISVSSRWTASRRSERAHHQILFARNQTYQREHLTALLEKDGSLFEHWTHDASIVPSAFFRYWKHKFRDEEEVLVERWRKWRGEGFEDAFDETYERVQRDGAIMAREIKADGHVSGGWWNWHPNKTALEYFWRTGKFAIAGRSNFQKVYDLVERVIPAEFHEPEVSREEFVDWACRSALDAPRICHPWRGRRLLGSALAGGSQGLGDGAPRRADGSADRAGARRQAARRPWPSQTSSRRARHLPGSRRPAFAC